MRRTKEQQQKLPASVDGAGSHDLHAHSMTHTHIEFDTLAHAQKQSVAHTNTHTHVHAAAFLLCCIMKENLWPTFSSLHSSTNVLTYF